jgi:hypothetical protein
MGDQWRNFRIPQRKKKSEFSVINQNVLIAKSTYVHSHSLIFLLYVIERRLPFIFQNSWLNLNSCENRSREPVSKQLSLVF